MSKHLIWWIDDNEDGRREEIAATLGEQLPTLSVEYSYPKKASDRLLSGDYPETDLVLVDWKLNENENENAEYTGKGLTMAATVREQLVDIPIYGFSSEELDSWSSPATDDQFQEQLPLSRLDSRETAERIGNDIRDYELIESARGNGFEALAETLNPPEGHVSDLKGIIPREFTTGLNSDSMEDGGSRNEFAEWVRQRFLCTPGLLLDDTWTATRLGISYESFDSYVDILLESNNDDLQYEGIFSHSHERLWWNSELVSAIVELNETGKLISELNKSAPEILEVDESDIAKCSVCGEQYPDTVVAVLEGENATEPAHYRCSSVHHSREGSFKDYRVKSRRDQ